MQMGMVGLGQMGSNLVRRLMAAGHECGVYDVSAGAVEGLVGEGATGAGEAAGGVGDGPPGGITERTVGELGELLETGDAIIDGGNSYYRDDVARAAALSGKGLHYVDMGTSGGEWGLERGYSLMIGGRLRARLARGGAAAMTVIAAAADPRAVAPMRPEDQVLILFGATGDRRLGQAQVCRPACFISPWRA